MHNEMPMVQDEYRKLSALAGKWTGEEKLFPSPWDPKGGTATGRIESRVDLDGFYLTSDYVQERDGKVSYRGHGVIGWDPTEKRYLMHWFDSMGMACTTPASGRWEGNKLSFEQRSPMGYGRYNYTFEKDGTYRFVMENSQDGKQW